MKKLGYIFLAVVLLFQISIKLHSQVTLDDGTVPSVAEASTTGNIISLDHTTGTGTDRLMMVGISWNSNTSAVTISSVTFTPVGEEAIPLTAVISQKHSSNNRYSAIYSLLNPPSGKTGTVAITFSGSISNGVVAGAANFAGVDQTTPLGTPTGASSPSNNTTVTVDLTGLNGDELIFDNVFLGGASPVTALTVGADQSELWNATASNTRGASSTEQATSSSATMSWTAGSSSMWVTAAVPINPAPTGPSHDLTMAAAPPEGGTTDPAVGVHSYSEGTIVDITAIPNVGYVFDSWTGDVANVNSASTTVTVDGDKTVTANFTAQTFDLTMAVDAGGGGSTDPESGIHTFGAGAAINITAIPDEGYLFDYWIGDVSNVYSETTSVTMDGSKTVTAVFAEPGTLALAGTASSNSAESGSSIDIAHTTDISTGQLMLVGASWNSNNSAVTISSVTFTPDGEAAIPLTEVISQKHGSNYRYSSIFSLLNPPRGVSGTVTVNLSESISNGIVAGVVNFSGVDQTNPLGTPVGAYSPSNNTTVAVDVTGLNGDEFIFDNVFLGGNPPAAITADPDQAELWNANISNTNGASSIEESSGATASMNWTADGSSMWVTTAVAVNPAIGDETSPTVTIDQAAGQDDPTIASPINYTVVFSEPVVDFATGDVTLGGTAGATTADVTEVTPNDGTTFNLAVSGMTTSGTVTAEIAAGVATDAAGNPNEASTSSDNEVTYTLDNTNPAVAIDQDTGQADPTGDSPINFAVVFNESVTGFETGDVTLGGTAGATTAEVTEVAPNDGTTFNVAVSGMTASGTVTAEIAAGVATDLADNPNDASTSSDNEVTYEYTAPLIAYLGDIGSAYDNNAATTLQIPVGPSGAEVGNTIIVGFASRGAATYNEPVVTDDAGNTYNLATYAVTYQHGRSYIYYAYVENALANGDNITITTSSVASRVAVASVFSGLLQVDVLDQALANPTGTSTTEQGNNPTVGPTGTTIQDEELVIGVIGTEELTDAGIGTWENDFAAGPQIKTSGASNEWRVSMGYKIVTSAGEFTASKTVTNNPYWAASIATFKAAEPDETSPTVTIDQAAGQDDPTIASPINYTVVFSEPVVDFATGDVTLGGTAGATTADVTEVAPNDGTTFNLAVSGMTTSGTVTAEIAAGVATDAAGNPNEASTSSDNEVTYTPTEYGLTMNIVGNGSVSTDPDQLTFIQGYEVELTAVPDEGWEFSDWSGDLAGMNNPAVLTMDDDKTVTVTFIEAIQRDTINIDFGYNSTATVSTGWNNVVRQAQGSKMNLVNMNGIFSGYTLEITDPFAGVNPDGNAADGALGIPATASSDSYYGNTVEFEGKVEPSGEIAISKLDTSKSYSFVIFSSRGGVSDNRETKYTLTGKTTSIVYLDASNNTANTANVSGLYPSDDGTIIIRAEAGEQNDNPYSFYYLGVIRMLYESSPLTLLYPNGVEDLEVGTETNIQWYSTDVDNIDIDYSTDNGLSWNPIASSIPVSSYFYNWTVPGTLSDECLVRLTDSSDPALADSSNQTFSIVPIEILTLTDTVKVDFGDLTMITEDGGWNNFTDYTLGASLDLINSKGFITGISMEMVDELTGINMDGAIADASLGIPSTASGDSFFGLGSEDILGELSISGLDKDVSYYFNIFSSRDEMTDYRETKYTITGESTEFVYLNASNNTLNSVSTGGIYPTGDGTINIKVEVGEYNTSYFGFYYLGVLQMGYNGNDSLVVGSPNGGENWLTGSSQNITWASSGIDGNVHIEYSTDNGSSWADVIASTPDNGMFEWVVPDIPSAQCLVRVSTIDGITTDVSDAVFQIVESGQTTQEISLMEGWNIFSINVIPDDIAMMSIVQSLIDEGSLVKIQNETGSAIEPLPGDLGWIDNIGDWSSTEGYKIKVSQSTVLSITGTAVTGPVDIDLQTGWNIMGYPASAPQSALDALNDLITSELLMKVQDETGAAIEPLPGDLGWIDNIGDLEPGEGYKIRVSSDGILTITEPEGGTLKSTYGLKVTQPSYFNTIWEGNGYDHMNIYLLNTSDEKSMLQAGDEIGVFDGSLCVGAAVIPDENPGYISLAASADDPTTAEVDGFVTGSDLSLRLWRSSTQVEAQYAKPGFLPGYSNIFESMGTTMIILNPSIGENNESQSVIGSLAGYPNPFKDQLILEFSLADPADVRIQITDVLGNLVAVRELKGIDSGKNQWIWDGKTNTGVEALPGYYFVQLSCGDLSPSKVLRVVKR